ncbi:MAG TPA: ATP-binding cassette domain-containing protein [Bryobacteraceae bacterium]|nr:ATP-binding cassette domain-containing protein [Bryobacteraceae bacterium]
MTTTEPTTAAPSTREPAVVRFADVGLHFGDTPALDHVSLELHAGQTYVVFGAAGSGKTTLLKVAAGLVKPDSGRVYLFGQDITGWKEQQLFDVRARIGILFQEGGLFDSLNIEENVAYPLLNQRLLQEAIAHGNGSGRPPRSVDDRVREALRFVELEETLEKFPSELSGGMRRRVGIARAIVAEPALMLYDSPTAGLDPITANTIVSLIIRGRDLRNAATFMVTHRYQDGHMMANFRYNPNSEKIEPVSHGASNSSSISTRFLVMNQGRIAFEGSEAELQASTDPYVRKFLRIGGA